MTCGHCESRLSAYLDGELNGREMLAVRAHLAQCQDCEREYQAMEILKEEIQKLSEVEVPDASLQRVKAGVINRIDSPVQRERQRIVAAVAAASVLGVLLAVQFSRPAASGEQPGEFDYAADQAYSAGSGSVMTHAPIVSASNQSP